VSNSTDKIWQIKDDPPSALWLARRLGISKLLASLLTHRNVTSPDSANSFLYPRLGALRDPFLFKDMDRACELISDLIRRKKRITIYGDYDVDGLTATSLLVDFFSKLGMPVSFYIPHRLEEGYSLNGTAIRKIAAGDTGLIITVDCGVNSLPEIALARRLGMEVIVTDHHKIPPNFQPTCPTIDPLRPDSRFPFRELSGVGLAFYLAIAIRSSLREAGFFKGTAEPDLRSYLDLVALGTVADMAPLTEENRILVKGGLSGLMDSQRPGIKALLRVSGIKEDQAIATDDISFRLAPRLNAMGRLGSATRAVHLLTTDNEREASLIVNQMDSVNAQRQVIENRIVSESRGRIERMEDLDARRTIVLFDPGWHRGVVGIVASKIVEEFYRPTLILALEGDLLRGSGRSIDGFDLYQALSDLSDLLREFGGHDHAAGVCLETERIGEFSHRFEELARRRIDPRDMIPRVEVDAKLSLEWINPQVLKEIEMLSPFGHRNPEPIFCAGPLKVASSQVVGKDHLKLKIKEKGITFDCIAFGRAESHPLEGKSVDILFHLGTNTWQGMKSIQLVIVDLRLN
jgi:single-stranded-DNA-specific exonuclease